MSVVEWWIGVRCGDTIWPPFRGSWLLFAVSPRSFEVLTTLTFRALCRNHIASTAFETMAKNANTETRKDRSPRAINNLS